MHDYMKELQTPDLRSRGMTRWWWYGCSVKKEEIVEQLDEMLTQGIGGVELQMLYPVAADDKDRHNIEYFSPEFFDILDFTSKEAVKRGMIFDVTLGSSWPYGGPFVPQSLSAPVVYPYTVDVTGPKTFSYDFTTRIAGDIVGCIMGKMENSQMIPESIVDLSDKLSTHELFNWPWGTMLSEIEIPEGDYKIVCLVSSAYRESVLAPMRGAEGRVIDHNRKDASRFFFEQAGTPIVERLVKGAVRAFFCDSIEVSGHNWTNIMYDEFEKRRGYSLKTYIYALQGEIKGITDRVRYDFFKTYSELTVENFFREMTDWCHEVGSLSRIQAHGTWGDILQAYGAADIPEGETFSVGDIYTVNTVHRRLASSAGNLYRKPIISNESFTWLRFPRFTETLEHIKVAADAIFVDGMNQIINHGFTYNPKDGEDWPFYASSHICNRNTWWPFYKNIGDYIHRVSHFMQKGRTAAEVCIYLPQSDIWAENPMCDLHMSMQLSERFGKEAIDAIAKAGYWFDYINDEALSRFDEYDYKTLIIMDTTRLPVEAAESIKKFAEAGNLVICASHLPVESCGLLNAEENDAKVRSIMTGLMESAKLHMADNKFDALIDKLKELVVPDLSISEGAEDIAYIHKTAEDCDVYFLSNMSRNAYTPTLYFKNQGIPTLIADPMTLEQKAFAKAADNAVQLYMEPLQSLLIIFPKDADHNTAIFSDELLIPISAEKDLSEDWHFTVPEKQYSAHLPQLQNWQDIAQLKHFSGTGVYEKTIVLSKEELKHPSIILKLGQVSVCARVYVNGQCAGDIIKYPYEISIGDFLKAGENTIRIEVVNLLVNRYIDPEFKVPLYEDTVMEGWPYFSAAINVTRNRRLGNWREKDMIKEPLPSGISDGAWLLFKDQGA